MYIFSYEHMFFDALRNNDWSRVHDMLEHVSARTRSDALLYALRRNKMVDADKILTWRLDAGYFTEGGNAKLVQLMDILCRDVRLEPLLIKTMTHPSFTPQGSPSTFGLDYVVTHAPLHLIDVVMNRLSASAHYKDAPYALHQRILNTAAACGRASVVCHVADNRQSELSLTEAACRAAEKGRIEACDALLERGAALGPVMAAAFAARDADYLETLLARRVPASSRNAAFLHLADVYERLKRDKGYGHIATVFEKAAAKRNRRRIQKHSPSLKP